MHKRLRRKQGKYYKLIPIVFFAKNIKQTMETNHMFSVYLGQMKLCVHWQMPSCHIWKVGLGGLKATKSQKTRTIRTNTKVCGVNPFCMCTHWSQQLSTSCSNGSHC